MSDKTFERLFARNEELMRQMNIVTQRLQILKQLKLMHDENMYVEAEIRSALHSSRSGEGGTK